MEDAYRRLTGDTEQASACSDYIGEALREAAEKTAQIPEGERVRVLYAQGEYGTEVFGKGSIHAEILDYAGAENVALLLELDSRGSSEVSMEQIYLWDPDVLILSPDANYDEIFDDPMWQTVSAVQTGRVYEVPGEPYPWLGRPPSVQRVLGLKWLGNLLYPELFDDDMIEETQRFSHREENLIDQMIQAISRNLLLPKWLEEDARSIGWCTFLDVYQKYPAQFLWTGVGGWARAYLEIQTELHAFQVQETARYYTPLVDQPFAAESKTSLLHIFHARHADFRS